MEFKHVEKGMLDAEKNLESEKAAELRDQLRGCCSVSTQVATYDVGSACKPL